MVSDTSLDYGLKIKPIYYAKANIPELWVIDVNAGQSWVHREPIETGFASIACFAFDAPLVPLIDEKLSVCVAELFV